jgi:hypothetical protein
MRHALLILSLLGSAGVAHAGGGMLSINPAPTFVDNGRDRIDFTTACPSANWALVFASTDAISRAVYIEADTTNGATICLGTIGATWSCDNTAPGYVLGTSSVLIDYSHSAWYCRAGANAQSTQRLRGYRLRDRGDYGRIGAAAVQ